MELGLKDKAVIVTGGSKGIGKAAALGMLAEGASVLICARNAATLEEAAAEARKIGRGRIAAVAADLTRREDIEAVVKRCVSEFGRIDILVNNAGSARNGDFLKLDDQAWIDDWTLKFFGYVRMARAVIPEMAKRRSGVIINVIGAAALNPSGGYMIGGAANAALNHFTKALADEGAKHGVRVAGINPGPILTDRLMQMLSRGAGFLPGSSKPGDPKDVLAKMTPLGRVGKPEEVADLIMFVASERAGFIHGANITIDGGVTRGLMG